LGGAVFKDGLNFRVKFWMKMKGDSCLVLRMTIKTSAEITRWEVKK
jgi:hypothetical protein